MDDTIEQDLARDRDLVELLPPGSPAAEELNKRIDFALFYEDTRWVWPEKRHAARKWGIIQSVLFFLTGMAAHYLPLSKADQIILTFAVGYLLMSAIRNAQTYLHNNVIPESQHSMVIRRAKQLAREEAGQAPPRHRDDQADRPSNSPGDGQ